VVAQGLSGDGKDGIAFHARGVLSGDSRAGNDAKVMRRARGRKVTEGGASPANCDIATSRRGAWARIRGFAPFFRAGCALDGGERG
jgi:hypothetical protein